MLKAYAKRGIYNTILLGISSVVSRIISFFFLPFFLENLTLQEFGIWDFYQTFYSLGLVLFVSCASISLTRFYLLYKDDYEKQYQSVGNACAMTLAMAIFLLLGVTLALLSGFFEYANHSYTVLTIFNVISYSLFSMILVYIRVREWLWTNLLLVVSQNVLATALTVFGIVQGCGIDSFFYANIFSTSIFIPLFLVLLTKHLSFSWKLAKMQLAVSLPLLLYNILYGLFLNIDRVMIKYNMGYEILGSYSLLWRFGTIFQFFCMALMDASPVILFSAQKESNSTELIRKLLLYITIVVASGGVYSIIIAYYAMGWWFPQQYHYLMLFLPVFFVPVILLQIGRFFQSAFVLANNTFSVPIISCITLVIQACVLWVGMKYGLIGVFCANSIAFLVYMILCFYGGNYVYKDNLFQVQTIVRLLSLFSICIMLLHCVLSLGKCSFAFMTFVSCMWLCGLWFLNILEKDDKAYIKNYAKNMLCTVYQWMIGYQAHKRVVTFDSIEVVNHSYSNNIDNKNILVLGNYPPPFGGVAVHIQRVCTKLMQQNNNVIHFNTIKRPRIIVHYFVKLFVKILYEQPYCVMYHTPYSWRGLWEFFIIVCATRLTRSKLYVIEHDCRYVYQFSNLQKRWFNTCVFSVDKLIFIGSATIQSYIDAHIDVTKNYSVESAFLPPNLFDKERIGVQYPDSLRKFIDRTSPCLLANAAQLRLWKNKDLYGFDMCIDLLERLKNTYADVGIVFALADIGNHDYFNRLQTKLIEKKLINNVYWLTGQKELWPLFEQVDLFVRPTCNENFGVSIAESLFFKTPAVASDVCIRPQGTILFTSRNIDDFTDKVADVLHSSVVYKSLNFQSPKHLSE